MATVLRNQAATDAERVATLVRIYRSAILGGDDELAESVRDELLLFGIRIGSTHDDPISSEPDANGGDA
jgi:hypothetical protein